MQFLRKINEVTGDFVVIEYLFLGVPPDIVCFHKLLGSNFLLFFLHSTPVNLNALQLSSFT